jgi:DNA polymerase
MVIDFETYSELDVRDVGAVRYAQHSSTEILCMSYKLKGQPSKIWAPPVVFPQEVIDHAENGGVFEAHNALFECAIWKYILHAKLGVPVLPRKWVDTLATCAYRALPLGLDKVGEVLNLPIKKDKRGKFLLQKLSKPRKPTKKDPRTRIQDWDLLDELYEYCMRDADAEESLGDTIGDLSPEEYRVWKLDQNINWRGVQMDMEAVRAAKKITTEIEDTLTTELIMLTDGEVTTGNQVARMILWLREFDVFVPNLQASTVVELLSAPPERLPADARRVLEIRQRLSRASTKKLNKILDTVGSDGRIRGLLQYHGAGTGRWAGRLAQPHNLPRGDKTILKAGMDSLIENIKYGNAELLELIYGDPMEAVSSSIRGMFIAGPGRTLMVSDFSAIEARGVMWLANEVDALDDFLAYDCGEGPDIYCVMAEKLYGRPIDKEEDPEERGMGKVTILGCGYQMGVDTFIQQAHDDFGMDLTREQGEMAVYGYREAYPKVKALWYGLDEAAVETVRTGSPHSYSYIRYELLRDNAGKWLACLLPNGRRLWYYNPSLENTTVHYTDKFGEEKSFDKLQITYEGRDNKRGGVWGRIRTYGGMLTENAVQAISRDIMVESMFRVEAAGYPIILTVHDEVVGEPKKGFGSIEEYDQIMAHSPDWAPSFPVAVEGWTGDRYRKG